MDSYSDVGRMIDVSYGVREMEMKGGDVGFVIASRICWGIESEGENWMTCNVVVRKESSRAGLDRSGDLVAEEVASSMMTGNASTSQ